MYNVCLGVTGNSCNAGEYRCQGTGECIPAHWICDGEIDCPGGASDEEKCEGSFEQHSSSNTKLNIFESIV